MIFYPSDCCENNETMSPILPINALAQTSEQRIQVLHHIF